MSTHQYLDAVSRCRTYNVNYANNICSINIPAGSGLELGLALGQGRAGLLQLQDNRRAYRIKCRGKSNWYKLSLDMKDCRGIDADVANGRKAEGTVCTAPGQSLKRHPKEYFSLF